MNVEHGSNKTQVGTEEPHVLVYKGQMQGASLTFPMRGERKESSAHFIICVLNSFLSGLEIRPRPCAS